MPPQQATPGYYPEPGRAPSARATSTLQPDPMMRASEPAWLYTAILGNQRMLACLDDSGSVAQLFYPRIDAGPHLRSLLIGIEIGESDTAPTVLWLTNPAWSHETRYDGNAPIARTASRHVSAPIRVERATWVTHNRDVLATQMTLTNLGDSPIHARLVVYAQIDPFQRGKFNTIHFDEATSLMTVFGGGVFLALATSAPAIDRAVDQVTIGGIDQLFLSASDGVYNQQSYSVGQVSGAARYDLGVAAAGASASVRLHLCGATSLTDVTDLALRSLADPPSPQATADEWGERLAHPPLVHLSPAARDVYARSLLALALLTDRTGGIIAAPEFDPDFRSCGGYGMCWPRDGAFIAHALDLAGKHDQARSFYDWALRVQEPSGFWHQRYFMDGTLAPTWGDQFDETGAVVWAICRHVAITGDREHARAVWPRLARAGDCMRTALDPETGLTPVSRDLWEERDTISTYACASTWGAFHQLSLLAATLSDIAAAQHWRAAAAALKAAIESHLWDDERGYFARGRMLRLSREATDDLIERGAATADDFATRIVMGKTRHCLRVDSTIDTSSLGLCVPFGVFAPDDPRVAATARAIGERLTSPIGGISRYHGDAYRDGNPWVIGTLWLAWQQALVGDVASARALFQWAIDHRTALDLLPEQVDKMTGQPCWVVPLGWSHAMFIILAHVLAEQ